MKNDHKKAAEETFIDTEAETLDDSVVGEENAAVLIKQLREKLKKAESEKQEYLSGWQRAKADLVNARKRDEETLAERIKYATGDLITDLLPVLESFDMAMGDKAAWEKADKNWRTGVEYIYSQLIKALVEKGLTEIFPLNETFNHSLHEAVGYDEVQDEARNHKILSVVQKGYSLNGKLIKPAKVLVGEYKKHS